MEIDLQLIQLKLDMLLDKIVETHGKEIYCVHADTTPERIQEFKSVVQGDIIDFYAVAVMINQALPELANHHEYTVSVIFEYLDQYNDLYRLEGFSLVQFSQAGRKDLAMSKINGFVNLIPENPKLIQ